MPIQVGRNTGACPSFKNSLDISDIQKVATSSSLVHRLPGTESDLLALTQLWQWEQHIRDHLPTVLTEQTVAVAFQTVFDLSSGRPSPHGYEALARFPTAPQIPVGLWFRIAHEIGLGTQLELTAAETAVATSARLPDSSTIFVNSSLNNVKGVAQHSAARSETQVVVDIPAAAIHDPDWEDTIDYLRQLGVRVAVDDTPLDLLHELKPALLAVAPDYIKVDVLVGLVDNPMGRFNLADAASWCQTSNIILITERVEDPQDLELLHDLGVDCAQGYSLAEPAGLHAIES